MYITIYIITNVCKSAKGLVIAVVTHLKDDQILV